MKKFFITLLFPVAAAMLLSGCGESDESPAAADIPVQNGLPLYFTDTGVPETTALTTCTTLKPFIEMQSLTQMTFAEITRMKANDIFGKNESDFQDESRTEIKNETERE